MTSGSLVAARLVSYLLLLAAAGLPFHAVLDGRTRLESRERAVLACLAVGALIASAWWVLASIAAMAGLPIAELDRETVEAVLGATPLGMLMALRALALAAMLALLAIRPASALVAAAALPALASAAWAGHAGAGEGISGMLLKTADVLHLVGAALWIGALLAFAAGMIRARGEAQVVRSLSAFARTGTAVVAVLALTGAANAWFITDGRFPGGTWPALIGVKAALFLGMLGFAARNRWQLVPEFAQGSPGAARRLKHSLIGETAFALGIVAVVAIAGLLDPHPG